ncbi:MULTISPECIES: MarR family winged helix-turn-helix transcriptional regulator [unclassified Streptomyces]|uniref:MarR family winged helix-turn-helix transcriptional regulator n=1 Tax=unclassified Streptomyces TaxID=2593676 RepID=UPI0038669956|nr:MarR family winged helix-turn-helix transcriptional regulator [Streptomyces sp. NBC_00827]
MPSEQLPAPLESGLGHLLKHIQRRLVRASAEALAQFGIDGQELAALAVFAAGHPLSQIEVGGRLGVDRTTMAVLVDGLEDHGLIERRFLAPLGEEGASSLLRSLRVLVTDPPVTA